MNIEIVNVVQSESAPTHEVEDPVLVEFDLTRRKGGHLSDNAQEGLFDGEALLALSPGAEILGKGWADISNWVGLEQEFQSEFATVLDGTITCHTTGQRLVLRNGKAISVTGTTIYPEPGEVLCPFCRGPTTHGRDGHIEVGAYDGKNYTIDTDVTGHICRGRCGAWFFTGLTTEELATVTKEG